MESIMALRGVKPTTVEKRLKALFYGPAGCGKTTAAIQFPQPYLIDTEKGAENEQYVKLLEQSGGMYFGTADFDEMVKEITELMTVKHEFRTLIVDPLTTVYDDLLDKAAKLVGTEFGRHYGEANKRMKHLINLLLRLDMNVIITTHSKKEYGDGMVLKGETFDCWKKLDYLFDLVFRIEKRGTERVGRVIKTRNTGFPENDIFPFSYAEIAERYGRNILERQANAEVLVSPELLAELMRLIELLKVPAETVDKWLDKAKAETLPELPAEVAKKCVEFLTNQISNPKAAAAA
jgi:hypothetical protein